MTTTSPGVLPTARCLRLVLVALLVAVAFAPGACARSPQRDFASNGERIYMTGTSESGSPIEAVGVPTPMMHSLACADCHGRDGTGGRVQHMMRTIDAPDITWDGLTDDHDDGHDDHPAYTARTLRRAITDGLDPAGEPLGVNMPRFRMSDADLDDLLAYLMALGDAQDDH